MTKRAKGVALPRYEIDNGPLTRAQAAAIRRRQPAGRMKVKESLIEVEAARKRLKGSLLKYDRPFDPVLEPGD
jgi:hypothetical protein